MRRRIHCVALSTAMAGSLLLLTAMQNTPALAGPSDGTEQIRSLELAHNDAMVRGDLAALERATADDFTYITPRGFLFDKQHLLRVLSEGAVRYEYRQISDLRIRVYGDSAVVTGRSLQTVQEAGGKPSTDVCRYTRVYVRHDGQWLAVLWQMTFDDEDEARRELRKD